MTRADSRSGTVLVTGAAGFIGSAVCQQLASAGYRVAGYDNLSRGRREFLPAEVELFVGDIRERARLTEVVSTIQPACIIHLAAMHFIPDCIAHPGETVDVNVEGTRVVLECCRQAAVRRVIFASSAAVYAPTEVACLEGVTPLGPLEVYGTSKVEAEELVHAFQARTGASAAILRLFNTVGRRETNAHVIPHILESLRSSDRILLGNTAPRRDYIDSRDVAEAVESALGLTAGLHVLNVGTGVAHSVADVIDMLGGILGREITMVQDPSRMRSNERKVLLADVTRIRAATGWQPRITLEESLADLVSAYGCAPSPTHRHAHPTSAPTP